jgi:hypothetical protein
MSTRVATNVNKITHSVQVSINGIDVGTFTTLLAVRQYARKLKNGQTEWSETTPGTLDRIANEIIRQATETYKKGHLA